MVYLAIPIGDRIYSCGMNVAFLELFSSDILLTNFDAIALLDFHLVVLTWSQA